MLTKLINGKFSLKETFWKFGVLGLLFLNLLVKIFGGLLGARIKGVSILGFYTKYAPAHFETGTVVLTVLYLSSLAAAIVYCLILAFGIWRSSDSYDKSSWLKYAARIVGGLMIYLTLKYVFNF